MKNLNKGLKTLGLLFAAAVLISSCNKDKNVYADDFTATIDENPADSMEIGTISATTEKSFITYTLISESVTGALLVDASSGKLYVNDASKFNYETNPVITAEVECSNGKNDAISNVTINLNDVLEIPANVGDFRDGGVVFWVDPNDDTHGLVCAVSDQSSSGADWGCYSLTDPTAINGADGTAVGTGAQNTADIEAGCSSTGTAADICANLSLNGYTDWFLPSRDEMTAIYNNLTTVNATAVSNGGTNFDTGVYYWTSSEIDANNAHDFYFSNGNSTSALKLNYFSVRAVRAF